jgi:hypothetical protein
MSKYEQCLKMFKTYKFRELKLGLGEKATLLAIAKECDRLQLDTVEISDDRILELVNEERIFLAAERCKKLFKMIGDEDTSDEKIQSFMYHLSIVMNKDLEYIYKESNRLMKIIKPLSMKKRKELIVNFKMVVN